MKPTIGYETNRTENNEIRGHTYVTELTKTIPNLGLTEIPNEFFLGWINPYLLSDCMKSTGMAITGTGDNEGIEFVPPTYTTNIPMGYMYQTLSTGVGNNMLWTENGGTLQINASSGNPRFIKKFYPECYSLVPNSIKLGFDFNIYTPPPSSQLQNANADYSFNLNFGEFKQFVRGQFSKEITFTWNNYNMKVTLTGTDFSDGTVYKADENGSGYEFRIFLRRYSFQSFYGGAYAQSDGYAILPMIQQNVSYSFTDSSEDFTVDELRAWNGWTGTASLAQLRMNTSTHTIREMSPGTAFQRGAGACHSSIKFKVDLLDDEMLLFGNGIVGHKTGGYVWNFYVYFKITEIEKMLNLFARVSKYTIVSYMPDDSFATLVDTNDEFLAELHSGNIQDQTFRTSLRDWQYVPLDDDGTDEGTAKNEFDPETDLPPFDPTPPPEPDEEGNNPDNPDAGLGQVDDTPADQIEDDRMNDNRVVFGANAFITQYVLTISQLISLGQYLWSNITDPNSNGLKNFVAIFSDTGTFNSANCLQCFVSLKVFPFDMFNTVYSNAAPDLRAGSGYTALLAESVTVFSSCTYSIDCGSVDVTADGYNIVAGQYDFRNYINTTVCVFLPFCGTVELNPADVFGFTLSCTYYIDVSSGTCTACVFVDRGDNKRLMVASKSGQIGFNIPMSATNAMQVAGTFLSDAASAAQTISDTVLSLATSKALGSIGAPVEDAAASQQYLQGNVRATSSAVGKATSGIAGAISGLGNMMSRSGCAYPSLSGGTGMAALFFDKTPYVVIRRSNYSSPNNYAHTTGFSTTDGGTEHKSTLGAYTGWTVVKNCDLKNIHANREELDEIKHLLETGVFL